MKISYFIGSIGAGGKERQLLYLLNSLSLINEIQVFTFSEDIFFKEILDLKIDLIIFKKNEKYKLSTIARVYSELKYFKPDVIHFWDNISHCIALPYTFLNNVKIVNGSIRYAGQIKKTLIGLITQKVAFITSDAIISNSKQGLLVEKLTNSAKASTIYNGLDFNIYQTQAAKIIVEIENNASKFECKVVMVGRFYAAKDYLTYIKAAISILSFNTKIGFFCIGDGPNRADAENFAGDWVNKNIFFLGQLSDVHNVLCNFNIGVLLNNTTGHAEGISNAIMEYMAASLPVIATDAGGTPEIVKNGVTGYLVPAFNEVVVAEKILLLYQNIEKAKKMGRNGREVIESKFSIQKMTSEYTDLYKGLCRMKL